MNGGDSFHFIKNSFYIVHYAGSLNKRFIFYKVGAMIIDVIYPFAPILFLRLILNEMVSSQDLNRLILYVASLSFALFILNTCKSILSIVLQKELSITLFKFQEALGEAIMQMPYEQLENPKIRDMIELAKEARLQGHLSRHENRRFFYVLILNEPVYSKCSTGHFGMD